jgi:hypothetical protein
VNTPGSTLRIRERERTAILQSLRAGVVPRIGLQHIQVGRKAEVAAVLSDLEVAREGGAAIRFIVGRFGAGKSFFLNLGSTVALEKNFLVARADVTPDRRLHGAGGQARALYSELMRNLASKARPDGTALAGVVERWISAVVQEVAVAGSDDTQVESTILRRLQPLQELVNGFDFAAVLARYFRAHQAGDASTQQNALRWLRAEYATKTEARQDLGVRAIIDDEDIYDYLKLFARFARIAGYTGLVVCVDELVVLSHRLSSAKARAANYETILRMLNDCLQGTTEGLVLIFGATDEALEDRRRGLYSYEALATRLAPNAFAKGETRDLSGPVISLQNLTPEELLVLLMRVRDVFASGDSSQYLLPDEGLRMYLEYCARTLGDAYFRTPRETVTRFVGLMSLIEQDRSRDWRTLLAAANDLQVELSASAEAAGPPVAEEDDLVDFKL